jgi:predicted TPR repeat methyltransferase
MPARLFLSSGDLVADRRFEFARDLQLKGDLVAAADLLLQATDLAPGFISAWFTLGEIREQLGERDAAIAAFRKALAADPEDRHGASLRLMLLGAEKLSAMPEAYVRVLFDQYAPKFEKALVDDLGYRGPALLFKAVLAARQAIRKPAFFKRAIDVGCRRLRQRGRPLHRHRSVTAHDRTGARHRTLCQARGRRHGAGLAQQA